ncbi:hypothetical protein FSP39_012765 [Pinctada imbricata]|uniref:Uncharacterized protein n=1 Tax=Pinctada imbricata TaxID=66713 RepID=A0AA88XQU6_PINIB|nr:hypothetical protein FSP39_012765 [Pinctada imbricata]
MKQHGRSDRRIAVNDTFGHLMSIVSLDESVKLPHQAHRDNANTTHGKAPSNSNLKPTGIMLIQPMIKPLMDTSRFESGRLSALNLCSRLDEALSSHERESQHLEDGIRQTFEWLRGNLQHIEYGMLGSLRGSRQYKLNQLQAKKQQCDFILRNLNEKLEDINIASVEGQSKRLDACTSELDHLLQTNHHFLTTECPSLLTLDTTIKLPMEGDGCSYSVEYGKEGALTIKREFRGLLDMSSAQVQIPQQAAAPQQNVAYHPLPSAPPTANALPNAELPSYEEVVGGFHNLSMGNGQIHPPPPNLPMGPQQSHNPGPLTAHPALTPDGIPSRLIPDSPTTFRVRTATDSDHCNIIGLAVLRDGRVVVVDKQNQKLKMFNHDYSLASEVTLVHYPYDVAESPSGRIAVSMPKLGDLHMYKVTDRLTLDTSAILHLGKCQGLAGSSTHLFVSCKNRADETYNILVYDTLHFLVRTIPLKITNYGPLEVCPKHGHLYFKSLSVGKEKIYCMTIDGHILWKSKVKSWIDQPYGLAAVNAGVMVSIDGIHFLSGGGSHWQKIADIENTGPIAVTRDLRKLVVAHKIGGSGHGEDILTVYNIHYNEGAGMYY